MVSRAHGPCEPTRDPDGAGWRRGAFPAYPCLHGWLPSVAPCHEGLGEVPCRRLAGFSLHGADYRHHSSALAAPVYAINIEVRWSKEISVGGRGFTLKASIMDAFCSQCNSPISCNPGHDCWCSDLPHTMPVPGSGTSGCLCRTCLTKNQGLHETAAKFIQD